MAALAASYLAPFWRCSLELFSFFRDSEVYFTGALEAKSWFATVLLMVGL